MVFAKRLLERGVFTSGIVFPTVPTARIEWCYQLIIRKKI